MWEKHLKKKVKKEPASLLKILLRDSSQFLLVQINHLFSSQVEHQLQMCYSKQLIH